MATAGAEMRTGLTATATPMLRHVSPSTDSIVVTYLVALHQGVAIHHWMQKRRPSFKMMNRQLSGSTVALVLTLVIAMGLLVGIIVGRWLSLMGLVGLEVFEVDQESRGL